MLFYPGTWPFSCVSTSRCVRAQTNLPPRVSPSGVSCPEWCKPLTPLSQSLGWNSTRRRGTGFSMANRNAVTLNHRVEESCPSFWEMKVVTRANDLGIMMGSTGPRTGGLPRVTTSKALPQVSWTLPKAWPKSMSHWKSMVPPCLCLLGPWYALTNLRSK